MKNVQVATSGGDWTPCLALPWSGSAVCMAPRNLDRRPRKTVRTGDKLELCCQVDQQELHRFGYIGLHCRCLVALLAAQL